MRAIRIGSPRRQTGQGFESLYLRQIVNSKVGDSPAFTFECQQTLDKKPHSLPDIPGYCPKVWRHLTAC